MKSQVRKVTRNEQVNLIDIIYYLIGNWYWFILCILVCLGVTYFRYSRTTYKYSASVTAIIKNAKRVLDSHKDELPGIAEGVGVKQFTIYWRCDNSDIKLRNGYVVKVQ